MKLRFDEEAWSQIEESLKVDQVCGATANDLCSFAQGVAQRTTASLGADREVTPPEAEHVLNILMTLRGCAAESALGYARAVHRIDALLDQIGPAASGKSSSRRRARLKVPKA